MKSDQPLIGLPVALKMRRSLGPSSTMAKMYTRCLAAGSSLIETPRR